MKRFLVVGDVNVDIIVSGMDELPTPGQERTCERITLIPGGSSTNCASSLAGLGAAVDLWGKVGDDALGAFAVRELAQRGIGVNRLIQDPAISTGACVALSYPSDRALISYIGSVAALRLEDIPLDQIGQYDHLHSGSIFIQHGLRAGLAGLFRAAKEAGLSTSLDCGWDPADRWDANLTDLLPHIDYFVPNEVEALHLTGTRSAEEAAAALSQLGKTIVVKRGENGALARIGGEVWQAPAFQIETVETTGAGDCFNAGLIYALIEQGRALPEALRFANGCGAIGASTPGATSASPTAEEVEQFIARQPGATA
jgi:sugar/nucleoside kinase (ribokinase family)